MPVAPRLADDAGFTLVELLVAMVIGSLVLTAVMFTFSTGLTSTFRTTDRVDATQRARIAMDRVTTLLSSQVCSTSSTGVTTPPISDGQDQQVTFLANLGTVSAVPMQYRLRYDATKRTVVEDRFVGTRNAAGDLVLPSAPTSSRVLADGLVPASAGAPIFTYQALAASGPSAGGIDPAPLATPLSATDRAAAVRVTARFAARPERTGAKDGRSTTLEGVATVATADPGTPTAGVNC